MINKEQLIEKLKKLPSKIDSKKLTPLFKLFNMVGYIIGTVMYLFNSTKEFLCRLLGKR